MPNRIYLRELRSVKENGEYVNVKFKNGLNVISGASNTGKSYIVECIDYLFGSTSEPRDIGESTSYKYLLLEIETRNQEKITLKRDFDGNEKSKVFLYKSSIDKISTKHPLKLSRKHGNDSISVEILKILELDDKKLLDKKTTGKTVDLSLRILCNFLIVDENRIIDKKSPVYRDNNEKNKNNSAFKLLITGEDDSNFTKELESPEIVKSKYKAKIDFLGELIKETTNEIKLLGENFIKEESEQEIEQLKSQLSTNSLVIEAKVAERNQLVQSRDILNDELIENERLLSKYTLLQDHYESDLRRVKFTEEGGHYLSQLNNVPCPICNNATIPTREDLEKVIKSCNEEIHKIASKSKDLSSTIFRTAEELKSIEEKINLNQAEINKINIELEHELKPINKQLENSIQIIIEIQNKISKKETLQARIEDLIIKKSNIQLQLDNYKESKFSNDINYNFYKAFGDEVSEILTRWKYKEDSTILFDEKALDITIDGEPRINQGKGHRAITYAAFSIGLLEYTRKKELNNAGFTILDSPLLSLKEKISEDEQLSDNIQKAFWSDLSLISSEDQVIIIENKEPDNLLKDKVNFILFTGDETKGRRGFY